MHRLDLSGRKRWIERTDEMLGSWTVLPRDAENARIGHQEDEHQGHDECRYAPGIKDGGPIEMRDHE